MSELTKAELVKALEQARQELAGFKQIVKDRVIQAIDDGVVCDEGYEVLHEWGIPATRKYTVDYDVRIRVENVEGTPGEYGSVDTEKTDNEIETLVVNAVSNMLTNGSNPITLEDFSVYDVYPD